MINYDKTNIMFSLNTLWQTHNVIFLEKHLGLSTINGRKGKESIIPIYKIWSLEEDPRLEGEAPITRWERNSH